MTSPDAAPTRTELAGLIADALALVEAVRAGGTDVLPMGALAGLPEPPPGEPPPAARPQASTGRALPPAPPGPPAPPMATRPATPAAAPAALAPVVAPLSRATATYAAPLTPPAVTPSPFAASPVVPPPASPPATSGLVAASLGDSGGAALFGAKWARAVESPDAQLAALKADIAGCRACARCETRRAPIGVEGAARPLVLVLADPPDRAADAAGVALVGDAGVMLEKMLLNVVRVDRREVQVGTVVRCACGPVRPEEIAACRPFVDRQVAIARPRVVLALGEVAGAALGLPAAGEWGSVQGVPALRTAHPNWLLHNPGDKKLTFQHLQELARKVG